MTKGIELLSLFQTVQGVLQDNQASLNQADTHNNDHGDNMVDIFNTITQAVGDKAKKNPADQLGYVAELLGQKKGGSAKIYAEGFSQASSQFQDQELTLENGMQLVQTLMGGGEAPDSDQSDNPLSDLLSGFMGGGEDESGFDAGDLLNAGMAFMAAKSSGDSTSEALMDALISASPFGKTPHRAQSSQLVASSLMDYFGSKMRGK